MMRYVLASIGFCAAGFAFLVGFGLGLDQAENALIRSGVAEPVATGLMLGVLVTTLAGVTGAVVYLIDKEIG